MNRVWVLDFRRENGGDLQAVEEEQDTRGRKILAVHLRKKGVGLWYLAEGRLPEALLFTIGNSD